jgi:hypothetical protein
MTSYEEVWEVMAEMRKLTAEEWKLTVRVRELIT